MEFIFGVAVTFLLLRALEKAREQYYEVRRLNRELDRYKKQLDAVKMEMEAMRRNQK